MDTAEIASHHLAIARRNLASAFHYHRFFGHAVAAFSDQHNRARAEANELCMPFGAFHRAMEEALARPVDTLEFGLNYEGLRQELMGDSPPPTLAEIVALVPTEKRVLVWPDGEVDAP